MTAAQWLGLALEASIILTVPGLGLTATQQDATYLLRHPRLLARAVISMNVAMPIIAALIATTFALPLEVKVALVALAVSPVPPIIQNLVVATIIAVPYQKWRKPTVGAAPYTEAHH
jgi:bile acid:Na+ symporter, BASS family